MSTRPNKNEVKAAVRRYVEGRPRWIDLHELRANVWHAELCLGSRGDLMISVIRELLKEKFIRARGGEMHPTWQGTFEVCATLHQLS